MVIWLRQSVGAIGVDADVVRKEDLGRLVSLDEVYKTVQEDCARTLEQARIEAELILENAQVHADKLLVDARRTFEDSARAGFAAGHQRGLDDWHAIAAQGMVKTRLALHRMRERLAQLVVQAVEQVVAVEDRSAMFRRVGAVLEKLIADSKFMKIMVNSDELDTARADFAAIADEAGWKLPIEVVGSDRLELGSCVCEWDYGALDASIPKQLSAIRRAVQYALERSDFSVENKLGAVDDARIDGLEEADAVDGEIGAGEEAFAADDMHHDDGDDDA